MILLIDNYDSFTHNLVDYLRQNGANVVVRRNDEAFDDIPDAKITGIVLSPGPGRPEQAGKMPDIIRRYSPKLPILGICLGHQAIGQYFGARLVKAPLPMHGKLSRLMTKADPIFEGMPISFNVVRYHSLILTDIPEILRVIAVTDDLAMAIRHETLPIYGLQFHPEAILTEYGKHMINNWLKMCENY